MFLTLIAFPVVSSCGDPNTEEPPVVCPVLPDNQPRLNKDVGILKDVVTAISRYGYVSDFSVSNKTFTLAGMPDEYKVECSDEEPEFIIFPAKDSKDNIWYWQYTVDGDTPMWLMNGTEKVPVVHKQTPLFRTDDKDRIIVSFDGGFNYQQLMDSDGDNVYVRESVHFGLFMNMEYERGNLLLILANMMEFKIPDRPDQRAALEAIYDATNGDKWANNSGWKKTDDLGSWYGISCNGDGYVTAINLEQNGLEGVLPDVFAAFPYCTEIDLDNEGKVSATDNRLEGEIPQSLKTYAGSVRIDLRYNYLSTTDFYVPASALEATITAFVVYPQRDNAFRINVSSDVDGTSSVRGHNTCYLKHAATEGNGIDIYVMGDGYTAENHTVGGTVDYWFDVAYESIFNIDPMDKLKKYFNVWYVYGHSQERGVSLFDNKRNSLYGYWQKTPASASACSFDKQAIASTIEKATGGRYIQDGVSVMMVVNSTNNALYLGMMYSPTVTINNTSKELSIAFVPTRATSFRSLVHHEFVGHAYGRLRDEYGDENSKKHSNPANLSNLTDNVDIESDPNKCKWSDFYKDTRYASEKIDCYPGALNYSNVYRATETSVMNNGDNRTDKFNAPSRAAIYRKTMLKAFNDWEYYHEDFVKFDLGL